MKLEFKCARCGEAQKVQDGMMIPCNCNPRAVELERLQEIERRRELRRQANRRR